MKQHLGHLSKFKVLRFRASHLPALLLFALATWFSGLVMAEFIGDDMFESSPDAITWPMLPGESLAQLATLFYPGNKPMQRRFVAKTQELSHELNPTLDANTVFSQPGMLVIPELKTLSRHASPFNSHRSKTASTNLRMSYQIKSIVTPEMDAQYEELSQRNEFLKQELQHLQQRLTSMQDSLIQLKTAVLAFINTEPEAKAKLAMVKATPNQKPTPKAVQKPNKAEPAQKSVQKPVKVRKISVESTWTQSIVEFLIIIIALILAIATWIWIRKRLFKRVEAATNEQIDAIRQNELHDITSPSFDDLTKAVILEKAQDSSLYIEEIDSVTEEAKILVSMDRPAQATLLLLNHISDQPKASLPPWLYLLDIYRSQGQKDEFLDLAKRLHTTFNVMTPQWEETKVAMVVATSLEEFPHIISQLTEAWVAGEAQQYLAGLLEDNREGERVGFSLDVLQEIMLLQGVLEIRESIAD